MQRHPIEQSFKCLNHCLSFQKAEEEHEQFVLTFIIHCGVLLRIQKTRHHKEELLMVLLHPEIPLHNNAAELAARRRVRKRDVSFGPRRELGKNGWDTFMTLSATAAKLGVNFYDYLKDRLSEAGEIPPLAALIHERATQLNLGASWEAA